jgi:hypothetical protein
LEGVVICKENFTNDDGNRVILDVYLIMKRENKKVDKPSVNVSKSREKECQYWKKSNH